MITVSVSTTSSTELVAEILANLEDSHKISGLTAFGDSYDFPLGWGEVLPLHALYRRSSQKFPVVVLSQPSRRHDEAQDMIPELLDLGAALFEILERDEKKVAVIASCDLAHTHDPNGPYGYSSAAAPFDHACSQWADTLNETVLLTVAKDLVPDALSCGYTSMVMMHGLLKAHNPGWKPNLYALAHPTYYGMLVASFHKNINPPSFGIVDNRVHSVDDLKHPDTSTQ